MPDTRNVTENLLEMYGRNDWIMRFNFFTFYRLSGFYKLPRDSRILDCGCAMGQFITILQSFGFNNVTGLDASSEMVENARRITNTTIIQADIIEMDKKISSESYDVLILSDIIHHLGGKSDIEMMLKTCNKILSNHGLLFIREPWPTFPIKLLTWMSNYKCFYFGFLKTRLQSFVEEDELLQIFYHYWIKEYFSLLNRYGFYLAKDFSWIVQRITVCQKISEN